MLFLTRRARESIRIGGALLTVTNVNGRGGCMTVRIYSNDKSLGRSITLWVPELVSPGSRRSAREFLPEVADGVELFLRRIQGNQASVGIQSPTDIRILRLELEQRETA